MAYVRNSLSVVSAIFGTWLILGIADIAGTNSKATGMAVVPGAIVESSFSPWFWILAISLLAVFLYTSRSQSQPTRISLFWVPVTLILSTSLGFIALSTYLLLRFGRG